MALCTPITLLFVFACQDSVISPSFLEFRKLVHEHLCLIDYSADKCNNLLLVSNRNASSLRRHSLKSSVFDHVRFSNEMNNFSY